MRACVRACVCVCVCVRVCVCEFKLYVHTKLNASTILLPWSAMHNSLLQNSLCCRQVNIFLTSHVYCTINNNLFILPAVRVFTANSAATSFRFDGNLRDSTVTVENRGEYTMRPDR